MKPSFSRRSTMADLVPLPPSVEEALRKVCQNQSIPLPDAAGRRELAHLGEESALRLLRNLGNRSEGIGYMDRVSDSVSNPESDSVSGPRESCSSDSLEGDDYLNSLSLEEPSDDTNLAASTLYKRMHPNFSPSRIYNIPKSPHLAALGELEFRRAFLILSYCGKKRLEDVTTVDLIRKMKNLPMTVFESELWNVFGHKCIDPTDRHKNLDWDSGRTCVYHCHVDPDGTYCFKGPFFQKQKTHLQKVLGDDKVLLVKFSGDAADNHNSAGGSKFSYAGYCKVAKEGIVVGLRRYRFFVFKDGGKAEKKKNPTSSPVKCYFICLESEASVDKKNPNPYILFNRSIHEARCLFMHVHTVSMAKYMARLSLVLSKTVTLEVDLSSVNIESIDDIFCRDDNGHIIYGEDREALIHTDGTGFISENLAMKCPWHILGGNNLVQEEFERLLEHLENKENSLELTPSKFRILGPPLLIQIRLFNNGSAYKGTLLLNKKLPPNTIQIRPSMAKVTTDPELFHFQSANSLEIVSTRIQDMRFSKLKLLDAPN